MAPSFLHTPSSPLAKRCDQLLRNRVRPPPAGVPRALLLHGLAPHPGGEALRVAAVLAPVALPLVDDAVAVLAARVRQLLAHRPLEEALAALAAERGENVTALLLHRRLFHTNRPSGKTSKSSFLEGQFDQKFAGGTIQEALFIEEPSFWEGLFLCSSIKM